MEKHVAIVLSAGRGKRMKSEVSKQYLEIGGKPVIWYSLRAFEECPWIDEIVLVAGKADLAYCRSEIVDRYGFAKVKKIVAGGEERYHSVYHGLCAVQDCRYVYIHDGARPFLTPEILERAKEAAEAYGACVVGMPVKDTIKISDREGFAASTPQRSLVWQIQTPQAFEYTIVRDAYEKLMEVLTQETKLAVTDDAMVVEQMTDHRIRLVEGSYTNIKITTPEDLQLAESFLE